MRSASRRSIRSVRRRRSIGAFGKQQRTHRLGTMRRAIIIDTDPGLDDAVAILLALAAADELEVLGIVAVAGNLPLAQTERNARRVCELAGRSDIRVYAGCVRPLLRPLATAEGVHAETDRDHLLLPEPTMA